MSRRRNHSPAFKAKVAPAAIQGERTIAQIADQLDVHPNQVTSWKAQLEGGAADSKKWSSVRAWGLKLGKRVGMKKARVAVARKLAIIMHRMWLNEQEFRYGRRPVGAAAT